MISDDVIRKMAHLARLELSPDEVTLYSQQLGAILDYMSTLKELDTKGIEPLVTPTDMPLTMAYDEPHPSADVEDTMKNAPQKSGHLFKVPAVL